ncbi:hypothetical protein LSH36_576g00017 [Paralvinella palmiformis]|uniref:Uncharacterized protein n=1 Tax=Paralvinella palmiformis TaxID=53620 RepID=A0AAD9MV51_9ANNE|nr:hypothetical protein LSH36_576g00017 [Paralvinella palmiformis]
MRLSIITEWLPKVIIRQHYIIMASY